MGPLSSHIYMNDLNPLCGTDEVWPTENCFGTTCRIPEVLDLTMDCIEKHVLAAAPLGDEALDKFLHVGACVAAKFMRSCMYNDKYSDTSREEYEIYEEMNREIPSFVKAEINKVLAQFPRTMDEVYELIVSTMREMVEPEIDGYIAMAEGFIGRTIPEAIDEVLAWQEETFLINTDATMRPSRDAIEFALENMHTVINGETGLDVCKSGEKLMDFVRRYKENVSWNLVAFFNLAREVAKFAKEFISGNILYRLIPPGAYAGVLYKLDNLEVVL